MNDLGLSLAWTAVQVSLVLIPASALHAFAARRGPASGAWAAAAAHGIVVVLTLWAMLPTHATAVGDTAKIERSKSVGGPANRPLESARNHQGNEEGNPGWRFANLESLWERFESATVAPLNQTRRWGSALAVVGLGGVGLGLIRLALGLCSVRLCRSRGRALGDSNLIALLDELRASMGLHQEIEIRETSELNAPATAGWRNAVIFLPVDWRTWDLDELRAVLAHELAHVARRDYPAGLLARLALALHFYHPLVHWLSSRLLLEQELAADALGARFAGGKSLYLQSLSRMALRLDGKSPSLPARAFLPAKGTLIRRIAMLKNENAPVEKPWTLAKRALAFVFLLGVAAGAVSLQGPARGAGGDGPALPAVGNHAVNPFDLSHLGHDATCVVAVRPAELDRKAGAAGLGETFHKALREFYRQAVAVQSFGSVNTAVNTAGDMLRIENIDQICARFEVDRVEGHKDYNRSIQVRTVMIRTIEPFDWLKQVRAWGFTPEEGREGDVVYYKSKAGTKFSRNAVYLPDERTVVFDLESNLVNRIRERKKGGPSIAKTEEWERVSRDLFAVAVDNRNGDWTRIFQGTKVEAEVLPLIEKVESWVVSLANKDDLLLQAAAACVGSEPATALARKIETLLQPIRLFAASKSSAPNKPAAKLAVELLGKTEVQQSGRAVTVGLKDFGTIAGFAARIVKENPL